MVLGDTGPSVRVSRSETRLTVYRSLYVLCQLVAVFLVERLSVYFDKNLMLLRHSSLKVAWESVFSETSYIKNSVAAIK